MAIGGSPYALRQDQRDFPETISSINRGLWKMLSRSRPPQARTTYATCHHPVLLCAVFDLGEFSETPQKSRHFAPRRTNFPDRGPGFGFDVKAVGQPGVKPADMKMSLAAFGCKRFRQVERLQRAAEKFSLFACSIGEDVNLNEM